MAKYIFIYTANEAHDLSTFPEAEVKKMLAPWETFFASLGSALVDRGDAVKFGGKSVSKSGVKDADNLHTGYSVIEAENLDEAVEIAQGAPSVASGQGTIEVYEAFGA